jgi:hypothetical protein
MSVHIDITAEVNSIIETRMLIDFSYYFDMYLISNYGIDEKQFRELIKNGFPEAFI